MKRERRRTPFHTPSTGLPVLDIPARRKMSVVLPRCQNGNCKFDCTQCRMSADLPRCPHDSIKERCPKCLSQCQHRRRKDVCPECNRCPHGQHKKLCKYCNHWTCQVDGCVYKGHRFCSKYSLKHHTLFKCPMPKKQALVVAESNRESSMKYSAEAAAMSELSKKFHAEWAAARAGGGRVVR